MGPRIQRYGGPKMNRAGSGTANAVAVVAGIGRGGAVVRDRHLPACDANRAGNQRDPGASGPSGARRHTSGRVGGGRDRCGADACSTFLFMFVFLVSLRFAVLNGALCAHVGSNPIWTKPETAHGPGGGQAWP